MEKSAIKLKFNITGMTCAACSAHVTRAVEKLNGVEKVEVNLLTGHMTVRTVSATAEQIIAAVTGAGYGAAEQQGTARTKDKTATGLLMRFALSLIFLIPLFYISMGSHMGWALGALAESPLWAAVTQFCLTVPIIALNYKYFYNGVRAVFRRAANMDTLVAVGSGVAVIYSVYALITLIVRHAGGHTDYMPMLYFEAAAMILTLVTFGKWLESVSKKKTGAAIAKLLDRAPRTAHLLQDGVVVDVAAADVKVGDCLRVLPGEAIAVDGTVTDGASSVNEAMLSGESMPLDKSRGATVYAGSLNTTGSFDMTATKVGEDTTLYGIVKLMEEASSSKLPISRLADRVSGIFVPSVLILSILTLAGWLLAGYAFEISLNYAISVIVISCPCALGLATPVAIMVGTGKGAESGILIRDGAALESLRQCRTVVLDKTGTLTTGEPKVSSIVTRGDGEKYLAIAAALEARSEHLLGAAIVEKAIGLAVKDATDFESFTGEGVSATVDGVRYSCGRLDWLKDRSLDESMSAEAEAIAASGASPVWLADDKQILAAFLISDELKADAVEAVAELKRMKLHVVMLTGDNRATAAAIAEKVGVDEYFAEVRPAEKDGKVEELKRRGKVVMVGDGINDAPALMRADVGIAIGVGADIAVEAADIVLQSGAMTELVNAIRLSGATIRNVKQNLFWAFCYNTLGIPIAAGAFAMLGFTLSPVIAAAAMSLSSVCVVLNALRLRYIKTFKAKSALGQSTVSQSEINKETTMKKVLHIEGMMCAHCVGRIQEALRGAGGQDIEISSDLKTATVSIANNQMLDNIILAVEAAGYHVSSVEN